MMYADQNGKASSRGGYFNTGNGPAMQLLDINHPNYVALTDPDTAFWCLVKKEKMGSYLNNGSFLKDYLKKRNSFISEMNTLRFELNPSAVYFNPTERCNLNCSYCYIPDTIRKNGAHMSLGKIEKALQILKEYFKKNVNGKSSKEFLPQIVFHGSEPMLCKDSIFSAIDKFKNDFRFGIQTNGTLIDKDDIDFITSRGIGVGLSLDGHTSKIADSTRKTWDGHGVSRKVLANLKLLRGYPNYNVICTVTTRNMHHLTKIIDFFHKMEVPVCMLNPVRCTLPGGRNIKPKDHLMAKHYIDALDYTYKLYKRSGRKIVVANFANIIISIVAPTARRLMCDISPCGGGRSFFAVSGTGDLFPCSEFVGIEEFNGGNIFKGDLEKALDSQPFKKVTTRVVENIEPCSRCAIRHFCGSPCPAEAHEMNGGMKKPGAFCELYEEQVRYALRLIADNKEDHYLWDNWDRGTKTTMEMK